MVTFLTIIYVIVAIVMVLAILLQSGKGGGMGSALGGGASQSVFGGSGGGDFMSRLTQVCAAGFVVLAMYLAYASAHAGSDFLADNSKEDELEKRQAKSGEEFNYESQLGQNPMRVLSPEEAKAKRLAAVGQGETVIQSVGSVPAPEPEPVPEPTPEPEAAPAPTGDLPAAPAGEAPDAPDRKSVV